MTKRKPLVIDPLADESKLLEILKKVLTADTPQQIKWPLRLAGRFWQVTFTRQRNGQCNTAFREETSKPKTEVSLEGKK